MKKALLIIAVVLSSSLHSQNVKDYFFQPNYNTILHQVYLSGDRFISIAEYTISNKSETIQGQQYLISDRLIEQIGTGGSAYFLRSYFKVTGNTVILSANNKVVNGANYEELINTPIFKFPLDGKEIIWNNSFGKYVAKIVTLPTKSNTNISTVKIEKYYEQGDLNEVEYWCKGWGLSLVLSKNGSIQLVNRALFDINKINTSAELLSYSTGKDFNISDFKLQDLRTEIQDESLISFINNLKNIVREKDTIRIKNFLGGELRSLFIINPLYPDNRNEYYARELHDNSSEVWKDLEMSLNAGCYRIFNKYSKQEEYIFPWYEAGLNKFVGEWDSEREVTINQIVDSHDAYIVFGENVNVRSKPTTSSEIVATLSKTVVKIDNEYRASNDNDAWVRIKTLDDKIGGFISNKFLYTPQSIRVIIGKEFMLYKYDGNYFGSTSEFANYLYGKNIDNVSEILESDKYKLKEHEIKDNGWKVLYVRTWD